MSIKVTISKPATQTNKKYPKLMINTTTNSIWYVTEYGKGVCILSKQNDLKNGKISDALNMHLFIDYNEEINLKND